MPAPVRRSERMEGEVQSMEQRLQLLKAMMEDEKAKRQAQPGGVLWRSALQDGSGAGSRYVDNVLRERPKGQPRGQRGATVGGAPAAAPKPLSAGRVGRLRAAVAPGAAACGAVAPPARPGRPPASGSAVPSGGPAEPAPTAAGADGAAAQPTAAELFGWRPDAALPAGEYEDLLGPLQPPQPQPHRPSRFAAAPARGPAAPAPAGGADAFDEEVSAASFQEALRAWRGEPAPHHTARPPTPPPPARESAEEIWARAAQSAASAVPRAPPARARAGAAQGGAAVGAGTQAGVSMAALSLYERLQEQQRRDGLR